jgi:hypothetical protein
MLGGIFRLLKLRSSGFYFLESELGRPDIVFSGVEVVTRYENRNANGIIDREP